MFWQLDWGRAFLVAGSYLVLGVSSSAAADKAILATGESELPAHRVVLRISDAMLCSLMGDKEINRQAEVRDVILGTSIYGKAWIIGKPGVELLDNPDQAAFFLILHGTAYSRTIGYNGPAIISSRSITSFTATKQIVFEPGKGAYALPCEVDAHTQIFIDGIGSTRRGVIGRIVRKSAAHTEAEQHGAATEIARQRAERRIAMAFDRDSGQRLARLNWLMTFRTMIAAALSTTGSGDLKYTCSTTPHYLQIATSFRQNDIEIELPVSATTGAPGAPIQLWVHKSLVGERIPIDARELVNTVSTSMQLVGGPTELSSEVRSLLNEQLIRHREAGDWRVIEFDMPRGKSPTSEKMPVSPRSSVRSLATSSAAPASPLAENSADLVDNDPYYRIWTSGKYTANAEFLSLDGNLVRLRRSNGVGTSILLEKLSAVDQQWIEARLRAR
jgi:SLA1 homology domain 1, SHD1